MLGEYGIYGQIRAILTAMFNSLMPSLNSRSLPFVLFLGGFPSRCQNLSSGAIRPGGLLFLFLHEASLGWHKQHIISRIWLNHSKGCFLKVKGQNFDIFGLLDHFLKNWQVFFFYFRMNLPKDGTKPLDKDRFDWITLNVIFQGHKGINLSLIYFVMYSFPRMILMKCEETDFIKLL